MNEIGHQPLIKTGHSFVPPSLLDTVPRSLVGVILILKTRSDDLIGVRSGGRDQLGNSSKS